MPASAPRLHPSAPATLTDTATVTDTATEMAVPWMTHLAWSEVPGAVRLGLEGHELSLPGSERAPHELFCAAVAACLDASIRRVSARSHQVIERLAVIVTCDVEARGARGEAGVPVGFQSLRVETQLRLAGGAPRSRAARLVMMAERECVLIATLHGVVPIELVIGEDH